MERKSANMQVKTPQSQPVEKKATCKDKRETMTSTTSLLIHSFIHSFIQLTILLMWCIIPTRDKRPLVCLWQWLFLFVLVVVLKVIKNVLQIAHPIATHGIVKLNALFLNEGHHTGPMRVTLIYGKEKLVKVENILAWSTDNTMR
jgi:hypothetical protein